MRKTTTKDEFFRVIQKIAERNKLFININSTINNMSINCFLEVELEEAMSNNNLITFSCNNKNDEDHNNTSLVTIEFFDTYVNFKVELDYISSKIIIEEYSLEITTTASYEEIEDIFNDMYL